MDQNPCPDHSAIPNPPRIPRRIVKRARQCAAAAAGIWTGWIISEWIILRWFASDENRNIRILPEPEILIPLLLIWLLAKRKTVAYRARRMKRECQALLHQKRNAGQ